MITHCECWQCAVGRGVLVGLAFAIPLLTLLLISGCANTRRRYDVVHAINPCVRHIDIDWSKCRNNYCDKVYIEPDVCVGAK